MPGRTLAIPLTVALSAWSVPSIAQSAASDQQAEVSPAIRQRTVLDSDASVAARVDNAPIDPELAGFIDLPRTRTRLKIAGGAKLDVVHDFQPAGEPDAFLTSTIPVGDVPGADNTSLSVRQSRIGFELRRPTPRGDLRIVYENDFFDFTTGQTQYNLRHFYGQVANVLAGFTYSTLMDVDSLPDTLDYQGPGAMVFVLQPVVRYTLGLDADKSHTLAFAIEKGTSDILLAPELAPVTITPTSPWPDGHVRYRFEGETGHVQAGVVLRSVGGYAENIAEKQVFARGLSVSGSRQFGDDDYLLFQGNYGRGFGRYIEDLTGLAPDVGVENGRLTANDAGSFFVAYQHAWNATWRSTAVFGQVWVDSVGRRLTTDFHRSRYVSANAIWSPEDSGFSIGVEYLNGWQRLKTGDEGDANRVQLSFQYDLVR
jgi:hypothetical protein